MLRESISVSVEDLDDEMTVDEFSSYVNAVTASECADYHLELSGSATIADLPTNWIIFSYKGEEGTMMTLGYSLVDGKRGYLVTCNAEPHTYAAYSSIFATAAESLKIE